MSAMNRNRLVMGIGIFGIVALLIAALVYSLGESNRYFDPVQIDRFVAEQAGK